MTHNECLYILVIMYKVGNLELFHHFD